MDELSSRPERGSARRIIGFLCALLVVGVLVAGYFLLRQRHARARLALQHQTAQANQPTPAPTRILVYENEPRLQGSQAVLSGTLRNVSAENLSALTLELELIPRSGQQKERRVIKPKTDELAPSAEGDYLVTLPSQKYRGVRIIRITAGDAEEVAFRTLAGEKRPKESPPPAVVVQPPAKRKGDDNGFLNSPENPVSLP